MSFPLSSFRSSQKSWAILVCLEINFLYTLMNPRKDRSWVMVLGGFIILKDLVATWPWNLIFFVNNWNLSILRNIHVFTSAVRTLSTCSMRYSAFVEKTIISERYNRHVFHLYCASATSRALWNDSGAFLSPNGILRNSYSPSLEQKVIFYWSSLRTASCQKPQFSSSVVKILAHTDRFLNRYKISLIGD